MVQLAIAREPLQFVLRELHNDLVRIAQQIQLVGGAAPAHASLFRLLAAALAGLLIGAITLVLRQLPPFAAVFALVDREARSRAASAFLRSMRSSLVSTSMTLSFSISCIGGTASGLYPLY